MNCLQSMKTQKYMQPDFRNCTDIKIRQHFVCTIVIGFNTSSIPTRRVPPASKISPAPRAHASPCFTWTGRLVAKLAKSCHVPTIRKVINCSNLFSLLLQFGHSLCVDDTLQDALSAMQPSPTQKSVERFCITSYKMAVHVVLSYPPPPPPPPPPHHAGIGINVPF